MVIILIFHFNTFLCKLIVFQLCSKMKFGLLLLLEMPAVRVEDPSLKQITHFLSVDVLFVKLHCLHSPKHFSSKAGGNRKDGVGGSTASTGEIPSKILGEY